MSARRRPDWAAIGTIVGRDMRAVRRSKAIVLPMVIVPSVLLVLMPIGIGLIARNAPTEQVQSALAGQGVALARVGLVSEQLQRGELVEPFGRDGRIHSPYAYWLVVMQHSRHRPEVCQFAEWVKEQAALTRAAVGEFAEPEGVGEED